MNTRTCLSTLFLILLGLLLLPAYAQTAPKSALSKMRVSIDQMEGITWYEPKSAPRYSNYGAFYVYFGKAKDGNVYAPRLLIRYAGERWLFVDHAWARADGARISLPQSTWQRDHSSTIWEWSDVEVSPLGREEIRKILQAKQVTVRFEGSQYRDDVVLTPGQLQGLRDSIAAWEELAGQKF